MGITYKYHLHKGKKVTGLLYRQFSNYTSSQTQLKLYKTPVRPHLEYAAQVWDSYVTKDIAKLENVQTLALKVCFNGWNLSYDQLVDTAGLPTLQNQRQYLNLSPCTICPYYSLYVIFFSKHNSYVEQPHFRSTFVILLILFQSSY